MSDESTLPLSDIAPERARRENDMIDEQFSELEEQVASLEDEKATLQEELDTVRDEKEALEDVVATYRDQRREKLIAGIRDTMSGAAVDEDDFAFEFDELEEAEISTLETVKDAVETTVEAAGIGDERVSNRGDSPDLSNVEGDGGQSRDEEIAELAQQKAEELGMGQKWQQLQNGESLANRQSFTAGDAGNDNGVEELTNALQELVD